MLLCTIVYLPQNSLLSNIVWKVCKYKIVLSQSILGMLNFAVMNKFKTDVIKASRYY